MFETDLYRRLAAQPGNLFFSPYGVAAALALVHGGAEGATRKELEKTLGHADPVETFGALGRELARRSEPTAREKRNLEWMKDVPADTFGCHLSVANAMWRQTGYAVKPEFVETLKSRLGAEMNEADFQRSPAEAVKAVNAWAARATRDRIKDVLQEKQLDPQTRVLLANAIYFKARWEHEFSEGVTRPAPFHLLDGVRIHVSTMHDMGYRLSARDGALHALQLPYSGGALAMIVLLPDAGKLDQVERELDGPRMDGLVQSMKNQQTEVAMPKFRVESSFLLKAPLQALGLATAFTPQADFSRISTEPGFALTEVIHKTFVDVNERGTEAAAVTVPMAAGSAPPKKVVEFRVDRPFLFAIRDLPTKTTLFLGRVVDPR
jgi:serine protease inhibitor